MNSTHESLLNHLDESITTFAAIRRPDPVCSAAYDTLKQARAMIARALTRERESYCRNDLELSASSN